MPLLRNYFRNCYFDIWNDAVLTHCNSSNYDPEIVIPEAVVGYTSRGILASGLYKVVEIKSRAFFGFTELTSVTIPASVTIIGAQAFFGCSKLTKINVNVNNPNYSSVDGVLFNKDKTILIQCPGGKAGAYSIPSTVTSIGEFAFNGCTRLTGSLTIPSTVTSIGSEAFKNCSGLTSLTIPSTVTSIGASAFHGCAGLTSLTIPSTVTSIGASAFHGCKNLVSVSIPASVTSIGASAFNGCSGLTSVTFLGNAPTNLGSSMFYDCPAIIYYTTGTSWTNPWAEKTTVRLPKEIGGVNYYLNTPSAGAATVGKNIGASGDKVIPSTVTDDNGTTYTVDAIGDYAFSDCSGLTSVTIVSVTIGSVTIGSQVTSIGNGAFYRCYGLTSLTIPASVTSIGIRAFESCRGLTSLTIPASVTSIGDYAFFYCDKLTGELTIPSSVKSIGAQAFRDCGGLTSLTVRSVNISIGPYAFSGCSNVVSAYFLGNPIEYSGNAFNGTNTTIYVSRSSNWDLAVRFGGCAIAYMYTSFTYTGDHTSGLTITGLVAYHERGALTIPSTIDGYPVVAIGIHAFENCKVFTGALTIPDSVTRIGEWAFAGCSGLTSVSIPDSVTLIDWFAFSGCSGFTGTLTIPDSVTFIGRIAFARCSGLTSVIMGKGVRTIEYNAFDACTSVVRAYFLGTPLDTEYTNHSLGTGVVVEYAFAGASTKIYVDADGWTFAGCNIEHMKLAYSGNGTSGLTITGLGTYPNNVKLSIGIPPTIDSFPVVAIGYHAFQHCTGLTSVSIPANVTDIGNGAFNGCSGLTSLTIGSGVQTIGDHAFIGCSSLTGALTIPDSVTSIGNSAFYGCSSFTGALTLGSSVQTIDDQAFYDYPGFISNLTIPSSVTSIGTDAFYNCNVRTVCLLGDKVTYSGSAFKGSSTRIYVKKSNLAWGDSDILGGCPVIKVKINTPPTSSSRILQGNRIANSVLSPVIAAVPRHTTVHGTFSWEDPLQIFEENNTGYTVKFTPSDSTLVSLGYFDHVNVPISKSTGQFLYINTSTTTAAITGLGTYSEISGAFTIPPTIDGYSVVAIGYQAFLDCTGLTSVSIPESVTDIGEAAFQACAGLTSVTIPNSVTSIGTNAFFGCSQLTSVSIPDSVTGVGRYAFQACAGLTSVTIPSSVTGVGKGAFYDCPVLTTINVDVNNTSYSIDDGVLFNKDQTTLIQCPGGKAGAYSIPSTVTSIGEFAFKGCTGLTAINVDGSNLNYSSVDGVLFNKDQTILIQCPGGKSGTYTIPSTVTSIGKYAFFNCSGLTSLTIPASVTRIGDDAFSGCSNVVSAYFLCDSVSYIGLAFKASIATTIYVSRSSNWDLAVRFGGCAIAYMYTSFTYTGDHTSGLTITGLGNYYESSGALTIPSTIDSVPVVAIGDQAFSSSNLFTSLTIPSSVTSIGANAFENCGGLTSVSIPASVTSIGAQAFFGCSKLTAIIVDGSNLNYSSVEGVLFNKYKTILIQCPGGKTGPYAIPDSVTNIDAYAFNGCSGLTSVSIPASVTIIGAQAFLGCFNVVSAYFLGDSVSYTGDAFKASAGTTIYVTAGSNWTATTWGGCTVIKVKVNDVPTSTLIDAGSQLSTSKLNLGSATVSGTFSWNTQTQIFTGAGNYAVKFTPTDQKLGSLGYNDIIQVYMSPPTLGYFFDSNDTVTITDLGDHPQNGRLVIPSMIAGKRVSEIATEAFKNKSDITHLEIDSGVSIGASAFEGCISITSVNMNAASGTRGFNTRDTQFDDIIIGPDAYKNCPNLGSVTFSDNLTEIGANAFENCTGLTAVSIPDSATDIGSEAFKNCSDLTSVIMGSGVKSIGANAFRLCTELTSLTIGSGVTSIGDHAFRLCTELTSVTIPNSVTSIGEGAFYDCWKLTGAVIIPSGVTSISISVFTGCRSLASLTIPDGVTSIGEWAFAGCSGLTGALTIPDSVTSIGTQTFYNCQKLTSLTIGSGVTSIGDWAFNSCIGLTGALTIPNSVTSIGEAAFWDCWELSSAIIGSGVQTIGDSAFYGCSKVLEAFLLCNPLVYGIGTGIAFNGSGTNIYVKAGSNWNVSTWGGCPVSLNPVDTITGLEYIVSGNDNRIVVGLGNLTTLNLIIPSTIGGRPVVAIGDYAFVSCVDLVSLTIPASVTSIGDNAFRGCEGLTGALTIPNSVTSIGNGAFRGCSRLTGALTIPNSVTSIGSEAFRGCSRLTGALTIPNSVTIISDRAFASCSGLEGALTIPDSVTSIGDSAFYDCNSLTGAFVIPDSVTSIGPSAFYGCIGLKGALTIPSSVTSIGDSAFYGCGGMISVTFSSPSSVTSIGDYAFNICIELTGALTIPSSVTSIGRGVFLNCWNLSSVTIPDSVTSIGNGAFWECRGLTSLTIPASVTSIGSDAFYGCFNVVSAYFLGDSVSYTGQAFNRTVGSVLIPIITKVYVKAKSNWAVSTLGVNDAVAPPPIIKVKINDVPTSSGISQGNPISDSVLSPVIAAVPTNATVPGTFSWNDPTENFTEDGFYNVKFTPEDQNLVDRGYFDYTFIIPTKELAWEYTDAINNKARITGLGENIDTVIVIIPTIIGPNSVPVVAIGANAFASCIDLTSVTIPSSVTSIGNGAFYKCSGLTSLTIPASVTSIGEKVFQGCSGLTSVPIHSSVTSIGANAFNGCSGLTGALTIPASVTIIGANAFQGCVGLTSVSIPDSLTEIGANAFQNCSGLTSVTIGIGVTSIGINAFKGCSSVVSAYFLGNSVSYNGIAFKANLGTIIYFTAGSNWTTATTATFGKCSIVHVKVKNTPTSIPIDVGSAFENSMLSNVKATVPGTFVWSRPTTPTLFTQAGSYTVIFTPSDAILNSLGYSFSYSVEVGVKENVAGYVLSRRPQASAIICDGPIAANGSLTIPSTVGDAAVDGVADNAFSNNPDIIDVDIDSVVSIGDSAFEGCINMTSVNMNAASGTRGFNTRDTQIDGSTIGANAFRNNLNLGSVTFSDSLTEIGANAFENCGGLTSVSIPASVTSIGDSAFMGCSELTSVSIPASVTSINQLVFMGCSGLTSVSIPEGVTSIGANAFENCGGLTSLTIPASVKTIDDNAFLNCSGVVSVYFLGDSVSYTGDAFKASTDTTIYVTAVSNWSDGELFGGCTVTKVKVDTFPTSNTIYIGSQLSTSTLIQGTATVDGAFSWNTQTQIFTGIGEYLFKFTPSNEILVRLGYSVILPIVSIPQARHNYSIFFRK